MVAVGASARSRSISAREHVAIGFEGPVLAAGFVGAVGEHDQRRIAALDIGLEHRAIPVENHRRLRAVDAEGFIGNAGGFFRHPTEQADGRVIQRLHFQAVLAGFGVVVKIVGSGFAIGRDALDGHAVVVNLNRSAAGLLQVIQLEALAVGEQDKSDCRGMLVDMLTPPKP